tara:strand:- start:1511 stop:1930 length:420 start_codon:yes stop_codon:yes gene_type:complete
MSSLYETTLINLRILRSIEPGHRLDTTHRLFRVHQKRSQLVPVWLQRWWQQQDRQSDISRIQETYHQAIQCIQTCDPIGQKRMSEYIRNSVGGLKNLQTTYRLDLTMMALIDVILDQIQQQQGEIEQEDQEDQEEQDQG